jgi:hypothetical protein
MTMVKDVAIGIVIISSLAAGIYFIVISAIDSGVIPLWPLVILILIPLGRLFGPREMRSASGHSHGNDMDTLRLHEAGHVVAGKAVGGKIKSVTVSPWTGGWVEWNPPKWPITDAEGAQSQITFLLAGELAAGSREGCNYDRASVEYFLRKIPSGQRESTRRAATRHAQQIVSSKRSEINRVARRL